MSDKPTPKFGHGPIEMRRAHPEGIDNVGDFCWTQIDGIRYLEIALPQPSEKAPDNYIINVLPVCQGTKVAKAWFWNGDEDKPTLSPSIHCLGHWHGFVQNGQLIEA